MFCPKCGTKNDDNAWKCTGCGEELHQPPQSPQTQPAYQQPQQAYPALQDTIPTYKTQAILLIIFSIVFFCGLFNIVSLIFAIVALKWANDASRQLASGNFPGARSASTMAKSKCWTSLWMLLFSIVVNIVVFIYLASNR